MPDDAVDLIKAIDDRSEALRTRGLDLSFNEIADMYAESELIITPEYQRLFRWSEDKQSRFIESLILEMPVPPIYAIELNEGQYELIDGLQRVSTYLHFRGQHPDKRNEDGSFHCLELGGCDILPELNGKTVQDLPRTLDIRLKRSFIRVEVLRKESGSKLRYHMFKRLNTGGEPLSDQEVRNCTIRLLDPAINDFVIRLSQTEDFRACISELSEDKFDQKQDQELVLRFFAFKNYRDNYVHELGAFMTDYMEKVAGGILSFDYAYEEDVFLRTFALLRRTLNNLVFSPVDATRGNLVARFSPYHFEAFTLGVQSVLHLVDIQSADSVMRVRATFEDIKRDNEFRRITTGGGKNYAGPLADRIAFVADRLRVAVE